MASVFKFYFPDENGHRKEPECLDDPNWKPGDPVIDVSLIPDHVREDIGRTAFAAFQRYMSDPANRAKLEERVRQKKAEEKAEKQRKNEENRRLFRELYRSEEDSSDPDRPVVGAYVRVSIDSPSRVSSFELQRQYYEEYITRHTEQSLPRSEG